MSIIQSSVKYARDSRNMRHKWRKTTSKEQKKTDDRPKDCCMRYEFRGPSPVAVHDFGLSLKIFVCVFLPQIRLVWRLPPRARLSTHTQTQ